MIRLKVAAKILFGASAMAFAFLLVCFFIVLFVFDLHDADKVWRGIYPVIAWLVALLICFKYMKNPRKAG